MAEIIVVSDIHINAEDSQVERLKTILDQRRGVDVYVNGDILDGVSPKRLCPRDRYHFDYLKERAHFIDGNHDIYLDGLPDRNLLQIGPHTVLVMHGHQFDKFVPTSPIAKWVTAYTYQFGTRFGIAGMYDRTFYKSVSLPDITAQRAVKEAKKAAANVVVCGHTHFPDQRKIEGIDYFNTGCWRGEKVSWVEIKEDKISLQIQ